MILDALRHLCMLTCGLYQCDLCYARKIKCNREKLCRSCVDAGAPCIRSRPRKRRSKRNNEFCPQNFSARSLRRAAVPSCLGHYSCLSTESTAQGSNDAGLNSDPDTSDHGGRLPINSSPPRNDPCPIPIPDHSICDPANYTNTTSNMIRQELVSHRNLSPNQLQVLESALSLIAKFSSLPHHIENTQPEEHPDEDVLSPTKLPPEIFYNLLGERQHSQWPDHISSKTLERFCVALSEHTVKGQLALQYALCILSKATVFMSHWLRSCKSQGLSNCLHRSRKLYITSGLQCLKGIDFTRSPSLPMVQALLSGALLVQLIGETSRSWFLTALASRGLVSLGYHQLTPGVLASDDRSEIRDSVHWCYYMDKTLSMLLVRPSSLPDLQFNPAILVQTDPRNLLSYKVKILVQLAHVQDLYLNALAERQKNRPYPSNLVESLQAELYSVRLDILELRPRCTDPPILKSEWDALDFTYFSIACTALRLDSIFLHDQKKRQECVQCARKALEAMQECHKYDSHISQTTPDNLSWTVLLYPLTPFFVIFCNIVATSNPHDLQLLKGATATVSSIGVHFVSSMNLQKLLSQLLGLCSQLEVPTRRTSKTKNGETPTFSEASSQLKISQAVIPEGSHQIQQTQEAMRSSQAAEMNTDTSLHVDRPSLDQSNEHDRLNRNSVWDDGLLWELFNVQPSVEWFDAGYDSLFDGQQN